jgi:hypothetical protein
MTFVDPNIIKVILMVRDEAISIELCYELMLKHFNPRCVPAWSDEEMQKKVNSAYKSAEGKPGAKDATIDFAPATTPPPVSVVKPSSRVRFTSFSDLTAQVRIPDWMVKGYFEQNTVVLL